jgi:hypothetical protein
VKSWDKEEFRRPVHPHDHIIKHILVKKKTWDVRTNRFSFKAEKIDLGNTKTKQRRLCNCCWRKEKNINGMKKHNNKHFANGIIDKRWKDRPWHYLTLYPHFPHIILVEPFSEVQATRFFLIHAVSCYLFSFSFVFRYKYAVLKLILQSHYSKLQILVLEQTAVS